ncbi:YcnI family protein [Herbiconiux sp. L3-i23]|uniref:YcnI family copper-binding membrane protein n=1 Tax=Herbiconiux sp. L3-i23 TaxID=2905871 RepID=UPI00207493D6|nr:YcnI family protein [Herbiconiux sp. L3-i23]
MTHRTASRTTSRTSVRTAAIGVLAALALAIAAPLAANAHVTVSPSEAAAGSYALLTFRVPNESDTAGTVSVAVDLPTDTPFASVSVEPVPGWSAVVERSTLDEPVDQNGTEVTEAATRVVWTADAGVQVAPGQFQRFALSVGPVPEAETIVLPATQTYSDGEVVEWNATDEGADYPAPVIAVTAASADDSHSHGGHDEAESASADDAAASSDDGLARGLAITGLVLGAIGAVLGAYAAFGRRRSA